MAEKECQLLQSPNNVIHDVKGLQNTNKPKRKCRDNFFQDHRLLVFSQNASAVKDYIKNRVVQLEIESASLVTERGILLDMVRVQTVFRNSR